MGSRILIFGKGFIGERLAGELNAALTGRMILTFQDAQEEYDKYRPDIIINCIGYTGKSSIDDCEQELDMTLMANSFVPLILAEVALRNKAKFVHISTGCIYHYDYRKSRPITETDEPDYLELFYSRSKIYSDRALEALSKVQNILIARIRIPLDDRPHPKNILDKLIKYAKVIDLPNSITYIPDFIRALRHLMEKDARGIYNIVNEGGLKYSKLMDVYKRYIPDFRYDVVESKNLPIKRPNLVMSTRKLGKTGFKVRRIEDILEECVQSYLKTK